MIPQSAKQFNDILKQEDILNEKYYEQLEKINWLILITFVSFIHNQNDNASSNYCNDNRICDTNPMISSNRDAQSSDWSISKQTRKEI